MGLFSMLGSIARAVETAAYAVEASAVGVGVAIEGGNAYAAKFRAQAALELCAELGIQVSSQEEALEVVKIWTRLNKDEPETIPTTKIMTRTTT